VFAPAEAESLRERFVVVVPVALVILESINSCGAPRATRTPTF
jgi:hypothetical protein